MKKGRLEPDHRLGSMLATQTAWLMHPADGLDAVAAPSGSPDNQGPDLVGRHIGRPRQNQSLLLT